MNFSRILLQWYESNKRDLPWRRTKDPYLVWLSEIILQQTRVNQGLPYFLKFSKKYSTVKKLAVASQQDVLKLWQGLGYYSRARNMHETAHKIVRDYNGKFPLTYNELLKLKGVGEYTAAAIASISFGLPHPVVDGNVIRVLSRHFGIKYTAGSSVSKKKFVSLASELMGKHSPSEFNQAMMEFGAMQCAPKNPDCGICPLRKSCYAFSNFMVEKLPVKKAKPKIRYRYFDYLLIRDGQNIFLKQRTGNDIWKNMYDFPMVESSKLISDSVLMKSPALKEIVGKHIPEIKMVGEIQRHILSHQHLTARFWKIETSLKNSGIIYNGFVKANSSSIKKYPLPRLIERFLEMNKVFES